MPSKPRTLTGIFRLRRHADRAYNLTDHDSATRRVHGLIGWPVCPRPKQTAQEAEK